MEHANVDTAKITHISLCSGYGGIDLGLRRVCPGLRTVAYAEIEAFAIECLLARMEGGQLDAAPIWSDLKSFPWESFRDRVDILTGGYPCQPFSAAGKRAGKDDPRHLWPWIADGIAAMRPRVCFFENVEGHISLGLSSVISDLEELGYKVSWGIFSAAECGAVHQRKRVFILAVASGFRSEAGLSGSLTRHEGEPGVADYCSAQAWPSRPGQPQHAWEPPRVVANSKSQRTNSGQQLCGEECGQGRALSCESDESGESMGNAEQQHDGGTIRADELPSGTRRVWSCGQSFAQTDGQSGQTQPTLGGDTHGPASRVDYAKLCVTYDNRTDELRLLGNGVVPATAALAFRTLLDELQRG